MTDIERFNNWWKEHRNDGNFCDHCTIVDECEFAYGETPKKPKSKVAVCADDALQIIDKESVLRELSSEDAWK